MNIQKSHRQTQCHFATCVRKSRVSRHSRSGRLLMRVAASKIRASDSSGCTHLSFLKLAFHPKPTKKNPTELALEIQTALSVTYQKETRVHCNFNFSRLPVLSFFLNHPV